MDNKALFRTAMRGFNKEDVVAYIDKLSRDTNRMLAEKDARIKSLAEDAENANEACRGFESKAAELENQIHSAAREHEAELEALRAKIAELEKALEENSAQNSDSSNISESEYALLEKYNAVLAENSNLSAEKSSLLKQLEVYKEFEGVQRDLGTIIIKAEKNAAEIVAKAKKDAEAMINEAIHVTEELTDRRIKACAQIADSFERSKSSIDEAYRTLNEKLDDIKGSAAAFYTSLEDSERIVHQNVDEMTGTKYESDSGFINNK